MGGAAGGEGAHLYTEDDAAGLAVGARRSARQATRRHRHERAAVLHRLDAGEREQDERATGDEEAEGDEEELVSGHLRTPASTACVGACV